MLFSALGLKRVLLSVCGAIIFLAACDIFYTEYRKRQIFIDTQGNFAEAANLIWQSQNLYLRPCLSASHNSTNAARPGQKNSGQQKPGQQKLGRQKREQLSELKLLAAALFMIERFASSNTERIIEESLVRGALLVKWPITTLSIGPGQIKPSSILKISPSQNSFIEKSALIHNLLAPCKALNLGVKMLKAAYQKRAVQPVFFRQKTVFALAREYNGQKSDDTGRKKNHTALLAHEAYNHLAYHLFQKLRFSFYLAKP